MLTPPPASKLPLATFFGERTRARLTADFVVAPGEIRGGHQEVHEEDVGRDPPAEVVLGRRPQPDVTQRK